jgi:ubiquinone/menaquinone biosynthesis C-methylase UbiE
VELREARGKDFQALRQHLPFDRRKAFDRYRKDPDHLILLAFIDGKMEGCIRFEYCEGDATILLDIVRDDASEFLRAAIDKARASWAPDRVKAEDSEGNPDLQALGFERDQDHPGFLTLGLPPLSEEEIHRLKAEAWNRESRAKRYERDLSSGGVARAKHLVEYHYSKKHLEGRILCAGAGTGRFAVPLSRSGREVVALDISPHMLSIIREKAPLPLVAGDLLHLPFPDARFDGAVAITVLEHLPRYADALKEMARVVKPGGRLVVQFRSADHSVRAGLDGLRQNPRDFLVALTENQIRDLLDVAGLDRLEVAPYARFNGNRILEKRFGPLYRWFLQGLDLLLRLPLAARMLAGYEIGIMKNAPLWKCNGFLVIARK